MLFVGASCILSHFICGNHKSHRFKSNFFCSCFPCFVFVIKVNYPHWCYSGFPIIAQKTPVIWVLLTRYLYDCFAFGLRSIDFFFFFERKTNWVDILRLLVHQTQMIKKLHRICESKRTHFIHLTASIHKRPLPLSIHIHLISQFCFGVNLNSCRGLNLSCKGIAMVPDSSVGCQLSIKL